VTADPKLGWSPSALAEGTAAICTRELAQLESALIAYRHPEPTKQQTGKSGSRAGAVCDCGRKIRVSASVLDAGPITCGLCGSDFTVPDDDDGE